MVFDLTQSNPLLDDTKVDNIINQQGTVDTLSPLDIDIPDFEIIRNLNNRIQDSKSYWDSAKGFDLKQRRNRNVKYHLGHQINTNNLYRFQTPYIENELFVGIESMVAYLTAQQSQPEVYPAQDTDRSKLFAGDLEKALIAHSEKFNVMSIVEQAVRNLLLKHVGIIKLRFDPDYGKNGDIIPESIDPDHVIMDKNCKLGQDPDFICHLLKMNVEECVGRWPGKREEIFKCLGIKREGPRNMTQEIVVNEVWLTNYDKKFKKQQAVVWYFNKIVLEKNKNPNWIYTNKNQNFLDTPLKPFVFFNFINDGSHLIDNTTPFEQAINMQDILNKRGRQIMENADRANGTLVISTDSGLTKDDCQNLTGDPNQKLLIKTQGQRTSDMIYQVPPHQLPEYVMKDKMDARVTIHALLGTPSDFTGADNDDRDEETLGQSMMKKNQAAGRQDAIVRSIDRSMGFYFRYLTHMMTVWYDEKHFFTYNGGDGQFDHITISRDLFEDGIAVNVKSGTTLPFDKGRQEAIALALAKLGIIAPLDLFKDLHMDRVQQRYDNWYKYKTAPEELARDVMSDVDESDAYIAYIEIMAGKPAPEVHNPTKEFILSLRKLMINDSFIKAKSKYQNAFIKFVNDNIDSFETRTSLEELSQGSPEGLRPENAPHQPPQPQFGPQAPGMQPQGIPPQMGAMPPAPMAPMQQPMMPPMDPMQAMQGMGGMPPAPVPQPAPQPPQPQLTSPTGL